MTILVTNDDGYSEGLKMLFDAAKKLGRCYSIIPDKQRSAVSKALTLHKPLRLHNVAKGIHSLNGTPADTVLFALYSNEFERPALVLSGINYGDNSTISAILASGTIGACWEAALEGVPAMAFSMYRKREHWDWRNKKSKGWGNKKSVKKKILEIIKKYRKTIPKNGFYNINLPDEITEETEVIETKNIQRLRFKTIITKHRDPNNAPYYWLSGDFLSNIEKGSDLYEVSVNKKIVIVPVRLSFV